VSALLGGFREVNRANRLGGGHKPVILPQLVGQIREFLDCVESGVHIRRNHGV
jgi:hypothetical protein